MFNVTDNDVMNVTDLRTCRLCSPSLFNVVDVGRDWQSLGAGWRIASDVILGHQPKVI